MKRLTRLTNILLHLQAKRVITSQELADKFGISQRTVYRDIKALEEAGVPVIGEVGTGYSLMEGYRVPPLMFTEQEINALVTVQHLMKNNQDKSLQRNLDDLVTKVKAVLKYSAKERSEKLEKRVRIYTDNSKTKTDLLSTIQSAILNTTALKIKYHAIYSDALTDRFIEPLAVYFTKDNWLLIAHCRLRNELREFRVDRILELTTSDESFADRNFSFEDYIYQISQKWVNPTDITLT